MSPNVDEHVHVRVSDSITSLYHLRIQTLSAWILDSSFHVLTATSISPAHAEGSACHGARGPDRLPPARGTERFRSLSSRVPVDIVQDATREDLREWATEAPDGAAVPDVDGLVAAAERRRNRAGSHRYEDASEFLSGG